MHIIVLFLYYQNAEMSFNFGATAFKYPPPKGFTALADAPKNCIKESAIVGE